MVVDARDLEVVRWLMSAHPEAARVGAQDELDRLRTRLAGANDPPEGSTLQAMTRMWQRQADRIENDIEIFDAMWSRSPRVWAELNESRFLNESQVAALVIVERRGRHVAGREYARAHARATHTGYGSWTGLYVGLDMDQLLQHVHEYLRTQMRLTTNMPVSRLDSLLADSGEKFRNQWETGTSLGFHDPRERAETEAWLGYPAAMRRVHQPGLGDMPTYEAAADRPKYATLTSRLQPAREASATWSSSGSRRSVSAPPSPPRTVSKNAWRSKEREG
jgi:hypothetical protein